ncbi:hypothetical protein ASE85_03300 [Sphingobium sp. Leaf26]|uniref:hypothetical protein n=1 Tax=Sphingobium sp. Leaf26 TaxID=1735693 RepID=UPI0006FA2AB6|nr:hypothetical protein [Sphingobium sp. Leaf26]KQN09970.1 hypothetical protein ASE85_03300 [Sphingobium sp. Leaf26]
MTEEEMQARIEELEAQADQLKADKRKAIGEKNTANNAAKAAQDAIDQAQAEAALNSGNVETVKTELNSTIKKLQEQLADRDQQLEKLQIDGGIAAALTENQVFDHFHRPLVAMLKAEAKMVAGVAQIDGVPVPEYIKGFLTSAEGKHYVPAPDNSGSGATGATGRTGSNFTKPPETAEEWQRFMQLTVTNPAETNSLADKWSMPELRV